MPTLTNCRHERFAQELAKGKSAAEAYTLAGFKPTGRTRPAYNGLNNILHRVAEIQALTADMERQATQAAAEALAIDANG